MVPENKNSEHKSFVSISKESLSQLPVATYTGEICVIDAKSQIKAAVEELKKAPIIGFDTETRPSFKKGQSYKVALIQLSTPERCYLFRTNIIGLPQELIDIFEDPNLLKVGLSIHDDFHSLHKFDDIKTDINPESFIDLQSYVKNFRILDNSLSRLYGILFGERISKSQRLTNWEAASLTEGQKIYAALDAYACIRIYNYLKEGNFDPSKSQYLVNPEEQVQEENKDQVNPENEKE